MLELWRGDAVALNTRSALLLMIPPLAWSANAVIGRLLAHSVPPMHLNWLRWMGALVLLLPLGWRVLATPERRAEIRARWRALAVLGLLGVAAYNSFQYLALQTSTPVNVTLIASSGPVWMLLIGIVFYGERAHGKQWLGALLSALGVLTVMLRGDPGRLAGLRLVPGDAWMMLAAICWAFYSWQLARPPRLMDGTHRPAWSWSEFLLLQVIFGLFFSGMAAGAETWLAPSAIKWSPGVVLALVFLAVAPSVLAFRCWGAGIAAAGPATAAFFANLTPLFAALMSLTMLGEPPHFYHGVAFALIATGIVISSRR